ncbi:MAG: polyphosphate kinase 1 [Acidobacteria bacterium]|nr:polyphosphate kinase 1 [Acidobacteriota bacterium]NIQ30644.1 polyphosphate kinase 1 [Acidobacteriota bacterium]NIQ85602.1 polyphosphate kinase 1 [Acidobacteriota bacterium]
MPTTPQRLLFNRELSWLAFARRVLALAESPDTPLLERVRFVGIVGMLHDEFFMKRISGLKRQIRKKTDKTSPDGRTPRETFAACREQLVEQSQHLTRLLNGELRPALREAGVPILAYGELTEFQHRRIRRYFEQSILPILTPLAVDPEHPFPFVSSLGLNIGMWVEDAGRSRFVRIKVPSNLPRWITLQEEDGVLPLEQIIVANLDVLFPGVRRRETHLFRVTRGSDATRPDRDDRGKERRPGSIVRQVGGELKARRFAGAVRLQVDASMRKSKRKWLARELGVKSADVYPVNGLLGLSDLANFKVPKRAGLRYPKHRPRTHPRLAGLETRPGAVFEEIRRGDLLLHHPYHDFDSSVGRFIRDAAADPAVLAIKLTIYRTSADSPIVRALADAARNGKQVAVLVEITATFDEAPNIAWGKFLESEGVHVAYGVERLKTHVKLCLVVREEQGRLRRYAHVGTGNYHVGTARFYEDVGILTADPGVCEDIANVFNTLTGATAHADYEHLLVAPVNMRERFTSLIRREARNARDGKPAGIRAKMNQLQDPQLIRELYAAAKAGVPIELMVRGLCCLRPGVKGLSETIRVSSVVGRFLEHSRIFRFENAGDPRVFIGSADWMKRNLDRRVETIVPVLDPGVRTEIDELLDVYTSDNTSAWDCDADGVYRLRRPAAGARRLAAQEVFLRRGPTPGSDPNPESVGEEKIG